MHNETTIVAVSGLAELLTWSAVRTTLGQEDCNQTLVLYGHPGSLPENLKCQTLQQAHLFGRWDRIVDFSLDTPRLLKAPDADVIATVLDRLGISSPQLIAVNRLGETEHAFFEAYPDIPIVFYDNGLASHISAAPEPKYIRRVRTAFFTLSNYLGVPEYLRNVDVAELGAPTLAAAIGSAAAQWQPDEAVRNALEAVSICDVILGTSFYRTGRISHESERQMVLDAITHSRATGSAMILYKEHPRASLQPLVTPSDGVLTVDSVIPIEMFASLTNFRRAYSFSSSALLSLKKIFGIEPFVVGKRHFPSVDKSFPWVTMLHDVVKNSI